MKSFFKILTLFQVAISFSCVSPHSDEIEFALSQAGDNRKELEYVLDYYSNNKKDSLKLEAAKFLIKNMPIYYSLKGRSLDNFKLTLDKALANGYQGKNALDWTEGEVGFPNLHNLDKVRDIEVIKAEFLIDNIEQSFRVWTEQPWGKHISFEDFCEYILPYRIGDEPLENWKSKYFERYQPVLDSLHKNHNVLDACQIVYNYIVKDDWSFILQMPEPRLGADYFFDRRIGSCRDRCDLGIYAMRSLGIPVGIDMVLHNPDQANRHLWNFVLDESGNAVEFTLWEEEPIPNLETEIEKKRGKVYRNDFSYKEKNIELLKLDKDIGGMLTQMNLRDVSNQYFKSNEIKFSTNELNGIVKGVIYICVFDINGWDPIGWGEVSKNTLSLTDIEDNVLYALCQNVNGILTPVYYPFIIKNDNTKKYFIPSSEKFSLNVERKYTMKFMEEHMKRFKGGRFEGANDKAFNKSKVLHTIDKIETPKFYTINIQDSERFQYVRYYSPDNSLCNMAELEFYDEEGAKLNGEIIGSEGAIFNEERLMKNAAFDNDPLTFFNAPDTTGMWVGLDFGTKKQIQNIVFLPRNDDNFIKEGEIYELFYFGNYSWISLGRKQGTNSQVLKYDNAPKGSLFWLRNLTKGKEERIFSYENGKQRWW